MAFFKTRSRKVFEKVKMKRKKKTKPNFDLNIQTFSMTSLFQEKKIFETSLKCVLQPQLCRMNANSDFWFDTLLRNKRSLKDVSRVNRMHKLCNYIFLWEFLAIINHPNIRLTRFRYKSALPKRHQCTNFNCFNQSSFSHINSRNLKDGVFFYPGFGNKSGRWKVKAVITDK